MEKHKYEWVKRTRLNAKSSTTYIGQDLRRTTNALETFEFEEFIIKYPLLLKASEYFGLIETEYVEVEIPQELESLQQHHTANEGNVVYVNFKQ